MKRLFVVKNIKSGKKVPDEDRGVYYTDSKMEAKSVRDTHGKDTHKVSLGPDHMGKHGHKAPGRMRRQP